LVRAWRLICRNEPDQRSKRYRRNGCCVVSVYPHPPLFRQVSDTNCQNGSIGGEPKEGWLDVGPHRYRLGFKRLETLAGWVSFSGLELPKTRFLQCRIIRRIIRNGEKPESGQSGRILGVWTRNLGICWENDEKKTRLLAESGKF
jgi:hypothetical protein